MMKNDRSPGYLSFIQLSHEGRSRKVIRRVAPVSVAKYIDSKQQRSSQNGVNGAEPTSTSDIRIVRNLLLLRVIFAERILKMGKMPYRLAKGRVHFSVPSFVPETASIFFHEECWRKVALARKKGEAKHHVRDRIIDPSMDEQSTYLVKKVLSLGTWTRF